MFRWFGTVTNTRGDSLPGWQVECVEVGDGQTVVPIFADENGTPIASVSGVANRAVADGEGNYGFFVPSGTYSLRFYNPAGVFQRLQRYLPMYGADFTEGLVSPAGASLVGFQQSGAGAVARTVQAKLRETVSVRDFGAVGDGVTDDTAAIQAAIDSLNALTNAPALFFPRGRYFVSARLISARPISIFGAGMSATFIQWASASVTEGILVQAGGVAATSIIADLTLQTPKVALTDAIEFDYSSLISGDVILPRAETHAKVQRVRTRGTGTFTQNGWRNGVVSRSILGLDIDSCRFNGVYTGAFGSEPQALTGVHCLGSGSPVQVTIARSFVSAVRDAVLLEQTEGIYVTSCEFVTVMRGIKSAGATNESGLHFIGNHVAAFDACVDLDRMNEAVISGNNFYNGGSDSSSWPAALEGVRLREDANRAQVFGNFFVRIGTTTNYTGVRVMGGAGHEIGNNTHNVGGSNRAVIVDAAASTCFVARQTRPSTANTAYVNSSTTTLFEEFPQYVGSLSDILTSNRAINQVHSLATGASGGPSGVGLNGAVVETKSFDANTAIQVLYPAGVTTVHIRRRSGGSWLSWLTLTPV
jgi:hypothetical protein